MTARGLLDRVLQGGTVHLMGAGGAGMSGLGLLLAARGAGVTGCDRTEGPALEDLRARGIPVEVGHDPEHVAGCDAVVYSAAVPADHRELERARGRGIPVLKRSVALADLVNRGRLVAVTGTHGKTTTSALVAVVLEAVGADPTALVGGRVPVWSGNARIGSSDLSVVEADEYDRSFLALEPTVAVVTSVEPEHLDTYGSVEAMEEAFDRFVESVEEGGTVLACVDDPGARRRLDTAGARGVGYGMASSARVQAGQLDLTSGVSRFRVTYDGADLGTFELGIPGLHNVRNALAALGVALRLGHDVQDATDALREFRGVERRFQILGTVADVTVIDDYAHHPTEITAALAGVRQMFPDRRIVAAFQPHLYSRTQAFADEFGRALAAADRIWVTDVYPAREDRIPGVTGSLVAESARAGAGAERVDYVETLEELLEALGGTLRAGDVVILLGAGDIGEAARTLVSRLGQTHVET